MFDYESALTQLSVHYKINLKNLNRNLKKKQHCNCQSTVNNSFVGKFRYPSVKIYNKKELIVQPNDLLPDNCNDSFFFNSQRCYLSH